ncbi:hypothetical protein [Thaumasiovibrio subtropicus]|uniref:hypothetical protein n=1 Tax=Thaumasiovibrio subtropicus TaxID=1891207 RepID=UPI00192CE679|nr:hypothetical protein [Thaumasiovibrio subtropicus]
MFKHRLGPDPHSNGEMTPNLDGCPDIWELEDGSFAIIGLKQTNELRALLPESAGCGVDEEIVVIPRKTLTRAKKVIPDA